MNRLIIAGLLGCALSACGSQPESKPTPSATADIGFGAIGDVLNSSDGRSALGDPVTLPSAKPHPTPPAAISADPAMPSQLTSEKPDSQQVAALLACRRMLALRGKANMSGYDLSKAEEEIGRNPNALAECASTR